MTVLAYILGVLLFVVGVAASIGLHEAGHLIPGKLFDVKVTQFFIGFGRTLYSRQRGETEYGIKAIPLGGYCKLVGMLPPDPAEEQTAGSDDATGDSTGGTTGGTEGATDRVRSRNTGMFAQLVSDARSAEYDLVEPGDEGRLFYDKPWWKRVVIMGSGVAINIVLAFVLFAITFMGYGVITPTTTVNQVSDCVIAVTKATATAAPRGCTAADPKAPARLAGFRPGDRIVSFNGAPVTSWEAMQSATRANGDKVATVVVARGGREVTLRPRTTVSAQPTPGDPTRITQVGFLGLAPTQALERQGVGFVVSTMASGTWQTLQTIGALPVKLYHVARAALGLEQRDANGPISIVGAGRVAGEVASHPDTTLAARFFSVLVLLASLNLFLGLINLVPLPPFDGGGIATTLYEEGRRRLARLRNRPDPGAVDAAKLLPVTYVMAMLILVMSVILIYADIVAPIRLG